MPFSQYLSLALLGLAGLSHAASNDDWAQRSIYQLLTDRYARPGGTSADCNLNDYCGGTYSGIVDKLDYIQGMGFTAIQISPVQKNLEGQTEFGEAYHGYWIQDFYSLNTNFGQDADLKNLVTEVHNRGMYLMVDVVPNEMAYSIGDANMTASTFINYTMFNPFNNVEYFHPYCPIVNWNNVSQYENCWLGYEGVVTPDLRTENATVAKMLNDWVASFVSNYSIDGLRFDGAKQTNEQFFQPFISAAGVYTMSEFDDSDPENVCSFQNVSAGLESYPLYYSIVNAFSAGNISGLVDMVGAMRSACPKTQYLANFLENQDNPRFATITPDITLAQNAIAFTLLADGIPKFYYGQEQHLTGNFSPYNRQALWTGGYNTNTPIYNMTATLNKLRNHAIKVNSNYVANTSMILYTDPSTYATRKGPDGVQVVSVLTNQGTHEGNYTLQVPGAATPGTNLTEVMTCKTVVAGQNGTITVPMGEGMPRVYFPTFNLNGSGLCNTQGDATSLGGNSSSSGSGSGSGEPKKKGAAENLRIPAWFALGVTGVLSVMLL